MIVSNRSPAHILFSLVLHGLQRDDVGSLQPVSDPAADRFACPRLFPLLSTTSAIDELVGNPDLLHTNHPSSIYNSSVFRLFISIDNHFGDARSVYNRLGRGRKILIAYHDVGEIPVGGFSKKPRKEKQT
jgi:hypothetical protein